MPLEICSDLSLHYHPISHLGPYHSFIGTKDLFQIQHSYSGWIHLLNIQSNLWNRELGLPQLTVDNYNVFFPYQGILGHFFFKSTQEPLSFLHSFPTVVLFTTPYPKPAVQNSWGGLTLPSRPFCLFDIFTVASHLIFRIHHLFCISCPINGACLHSRWLQQEPSSESNTNIPEKL